MKPTFWFLRSSTIYFFISLVRFSLTENQRKVEKFITLYKSHENIFTRVFFFFQLCFSTRIPYKTTNLESGQSDTSPKQPYAVACPTVIENENDMNIRQALDHKALIVRKYYGPQDDFPEQADTCTRSIQLSAVFLHGNTFDEVLFGYEVFFQRNSHEAISPSSIISF